MLQTNNTAVCSQCLSHTGSVPAHGVCSLPAHTARALGCSARNNPRPALGCMHLPGPGRSGSGTQRRRLSWACVLCSSQVLAAQVMRCLASTVAATYPLPAARLSRCTTRAPSQEDVDRPDPQEVLAKKPAYSFVDNVSLGLRLPPSGSGCLSPEGDGLQPAISVQSFFPCAGLVVS